MLVGTVAAFLIGLNLLPLSLPGLDLLGLGGLGFTPWMTGGVFARHVSAGLRSSAKSETEARSGERAPVGFSSGLGGFFVAVGIPWLAGGVVALLPFRYQEFLEGLIWDIPIDIGARGEL